MFLRRAPKLKKGQRWWREARGRGYLVRETYVPELDRYMTDFEIARHMRLPVKTIQKRLVRGGNPVAPTQIKHDDYGRRIGATALAVAFILAPLALLAQPTSLVVKTVSESLEVSWTNATQNVDGSTPANVKGTKVAWGTCDQEALTDFSWEGEISQVPATATTAVIPASTIGAGSWCLAAYHTAVDAPDSALSNLVAVQITGAGTPQPPTQFSVQGGVVYNVLKTENALRWQAVGTVPTGVTCLESTVTAFIDAEMLVTMRAVPTADVQWAGTIRPLVVFGECG